MHDAKREKPSSATHGFFQQMPIVAPAYTYRSHHADPSPVDDLALNRVLNLYLPPECSEVYTSIHNLARRALHPQVLQLSVDAELHQPTLNLLNTFGESNRVDPLWVSEGWRHLKATGQEEGLLAVAYERHNQTWNRRVHQFALNHVWASSAAMTGCPLSMSDGAAKLLHAHLEDPDGDQPGRNRVLRESYRRLISRHPTEAWTSGQWMTERRGGSDVRGTETVARRMTSEELSQDTTLGRDCDAHGLPLGPWRIDGFKWFSSATDSDMTLLLAQTSRGLSLFYLPTRRGVGDQANQSELNGIGIQRLKNKLGTKSLPTAELELRGARGWLIGEEGHGVKEIATVLNITRLYAASSSVAGWGRGLAICRAYSQIRETKGRLLRDNRLHLRWMAEETVKYWAATQLTFFGVALLGTIEQDWGLMVQNTQSAQLIPQETASAAALLRLITPVIKATESVNAVHGLRACMECLGGVGYCENNENGGLLNIAKIFRDTTVNGIWEGTVNVLAEDVVRVITDARLGQGDVIGRVLGPWARRLLALGNHTLGEEGSIIAQHLDCLAVVAGGTKEELLYRGRELLQYLEVVISGSLLRYDAVQDGNPIAQEVASRWIRRNSLVPKPTSPRIQGWSEESAMDRGIFLGSMTAAQSARSKL
ncbi:putative acyl-CoA dehydrogenase [Aspergillus saccharolyticus JOP 1030-1]|uniref:Acyl-CoA dehydrogenase/oxidase C-terminal n=1 Tax=Aspergillus saccharolyticus JOP 1030-1 TaxID=1450539 RepID=A0A318ZCA1_9EURO|nr:hypothetical protein BP01DRAFT_306690 [Aspergillus saccharolyticus JOP 1030-1]PYH41110.1 hypothetical protein BP01DRAFT_306690 [Aspergillus saccharolyticus JOP 1030-1]